MKKGLFIVVFLIFIVACDRKQEKSTDTEVALKEQQAEPNMKKVALNIEGMTCEIGCARTIQSKLSKKEGVKFAAVNFDKKEGIVEFDANKISEKQIVETVEQIAGGDSYKVTSVVGTE